MFCSHCGAPITPETEDFCKNCGAPTKGVQPPPVSYEEADTLLKVACVFFPIIGIILYCIDKDKKPVSAKQCLKISLITMGISFLIPLLFWLFAMIVVICSAL